MADAGFVQCAGDVRTSRVLVVGAGGIGCELLKNLVLSGFSDIEVIDLDTIDVSNLNRQFLFRKVHVGKPKALVAKESAERLDPRVKIEARHDSIVKPDYGLDFFKRFDIVMNALDNRSARSHVNRMCLAAKVPLIESGSAGYLGQVTPIFKGVTECYECQPQPTEKTYPGCTIRNTPSEPIHCIVWAKHLFNQLFGEADPDEDVSPDSTDPELRGEVSLDHMLKQSTDATGNVCRVSTRLWATECGYDPEKLFNKLFGDDIRYLLQMGKLWSRRKPPTPLHWGNLSDATACSSADAAARSGMIDHRVWDLDQCRQAFSTSVEKLKERALALGEGDHLVWDKDNDECMNFVTACANLRAHCFGIPQTSRFDVKAMAGNIIPAIATTNAIIAGIIVLQAFKMLRGKLEECRTHCKQVYLVKQPSPTKKLIIPAQLLEPNPKCYTCASKAELYVSLNTKQMTVGIFEDKVLKEQIKMAAPDVELDDGKGTILISSEEGETDSNRTMHLASLGVTHGSRLRCDDFLQNFQVTVNIVHDENKDGAGFEIVGDVSQLGPDADTTDSNHNEKDENKNRCGDDASDEDDLLVVEDIDFEQVENGRGSLKRKLTDSDDSIEAKRACVVID
ncbi:ubiquitin-like activating enzyme 2 [Amblyomma americanum]